MEVARKLEIRSISLNAFRGLGMSVVTENQGVLQNGLLARSGGKKEALEIGKLLKMTFQRARESSRRPLTH